MPTSQPPSHMFLFGLQALQFDCWGVLRWRYLNFLFQFLPCLCVIGYILNSQSYSVDSNHHSPTIICLFRPPPSPVPYFYLPSKSCQLWHKCSAHLMAHSLRTKLFHKDTFLLFMFMCARAIIVLHRSLSKYLTAQDTHGTPPKPSELGTWNCKTILTTPCLSLIKCHVSHVTCSLLHVKWDHYS